MLNSPSYVSVNGTRLAYYEVGTGETVVFVHGAISDNRFWAPQVATLSHRYRCVALDQRYFGQSWPDGGQQLSLSTHADDLCHFLRAVSSRPVHLVATSYGAGVALACAVASPDQFSSLFLNEPSLASVVTEPQDIAVLSQGRKDLAPTVAALTAMDLATAVKLFCDWTAFPGAFSFFSEEFKTMFNQNARSLALQLAAPPSAVTAAQIGQLRMPVAFTMGEGTTPFFAVQVRAVNRAVAHSNLIRIPGAHHAASFENPTAFNEALVAHLVQVTAA